jgi:hypothetical protein
VSIYTSVYTRIYASIYTHIYTSIYIYIYASIYMSIYAKIYMNLPHLFTCLFMGVFIHLFLFPIREHIYLQKLLRFRTCKINGKLKPSLPIYIRCLFKTIHTGYFQFLCLSPLVYIDSFVYAYIWSYLSLLATTSTYSLINIHSYSPVYGDKIDHIHLYMYIHIHIYVYVKM